MPRPYVAEPTLACSACRNVGSTCFPNISIDFIAFSWTPSQFE